MILKTLIVVALVVVAILLFALTRPSSFHVQRSINIQASPEKIFALLNDFHRWPEWAPQDKEDPSMRRTYSGAASGVGAISDWIAKGSGGQGRMTIVESIPSNEVSVKVDFVKPFEAHNLNQFSLQPAGNQTEVTWSMDGTNLYVMKVMSLFINMDKMAGQHFETGLANLKTLAEKTLAEK